MQTPTREDVEYATVGDFAARQRRVGDKILGGAWAVAVVAAEIQAGHARPAPGDLRGDINQVEEFTGSGLCTVDCRHHGIVTELSCLHQEA